MTPTLQTVIEKGKEEFDKRFPKLWYAPEYSFQEADAATEDVRKFLSTFAESIARATLEAVVPMEKMFIIPNEKYTDEQMEIARKSYNSCLTEVLRKGEKFIGNKKSIRS